VQSCDQVLESSSRQVFNGVTLIPIAAMSWQSAPVLAVACIIAVVVGFSAGGWWSIPTTVITWVVFVEFVYPLTTSVIDQEPGFQNLLETLGLIPLFATCVLIGTATAVGFGCREAIRGSRT
jgi:hypothetical protein